MWYILRRPRAFWISVCNLVGLAFSLAGVVLLFWYALPVEVPGAEILVPDRSPEQRQREEDDTRRYHILANWGFGLVILGTLLEAIPPFCTAIGSWRRRPIAPQVQRREETEPRPRRTPPVNSKPVQEGPSMEALQLTRLLHDNMAVVITFVFSQAPIKRLLEERSKGYWECVEDFAFEVPRRNATRACLEIAVLIRLIDDGREISDFLEQKKIRNFGVVYLADETTAPLTIRELTNKIIHAKELSWDLSDEQAPKLICTPSDDQKNKFNWTRAEVNIVNLTVFCGLLDPERV
jgi:hypothetical protein